MAGPQLRVPARRPSDASSTASSRPFSGPASDGDHLSGSEIDFELISSDEASCETDSDADALGDSGAWDRGSGIFGLQPGADGDGADDATIHPRRQPINLSLYFPDPTASALIDATDGKIELDSARASMVSSASTVVPTRPTVRRPASPPPAQVEAPAVQPRGGIQRTVAVASLFAVVAVVLGGLGANVARSDGHGSFETGLATTPVIVAVSTHVVSLTAQSAASVGRKVSSVAATTACARRRAACALSIRPSAEVAVHVESASVGGARRRVKRRVNSAVAPSTTPACNLSTALTTARAQDVLELATSRAVAALAIVQSSAAWQQTLVYAAQIQPSILTALRELGFAYGNISAWAGPVWHEAVDAFSPLWTGRNASRPSRVGSVAMSTRRWVAERGADRSRLRPREVSRDFGLARLTQRRPGAAHHRTLKDHVKTLSGRARRVLKRQRSALEPHHHLRAPRRKPGQPTDPSHVWSAFGLA